MTDESEWIKVTLGETAWRRCIEEGVKRERYNRSTGYKDTWEGTHPFAGWGNHIEGCCAELANALWLGVDWNPRLGDYAANDIEGDSPVEVRLNSQRNDGLILRAKDKVHLPYVLVVGRSPVFELVGWIVCSDGQAIGDLRGDPNPYHRVAQKHLRPMRELKAMVGGRKVA